MNNEEQKIKIAAILQSRPFENGCCKDVEIGYITALNIADALIAAGIGDVSSEKAMRELAEAFYREKCAEYDLLNYQMQKSEYRIAEAEHRAKVLGRTLAIMKGKGLISGVVDDYIVQAEKELAEENGGKKKV